MVHEGNKRGSRETGVTKDRVGDIVVLTCQTFNFSTVGTCNRSIVEIPKQGNINYKLTKRYTQKPSVRRTTSKSFDGFYFGVIEKTISIKCSFAC